MIEDSNCIKFIKVVTVIIKNIQRISIAFEQSLKFTLLFYDSESHFPELFSSFFEYPPLMQGSHCI